MAYIVGSRGGVGVECPNRHRGTIRGKSDTISTLVVHGFAVDILAALRPPGPKRRRQRPRRRHHHTHRRCDIRRLQRLRIGVQTRHLIFPIRRHPDILPRPIRRLAPRPVNDDIGR